MINPDALKLVPTTEQVYEHWKSTIGCDAIASH